MPSNSVLEEAFTRVLVEAGVYDPVRHRFTGPEPQPARTGNHAAHEAPPF